ncbi:MAG TPA: hypothetical protein VG406_25745 [Isosphaeraceae bacterium]|nr:hypothetical protein [Isosphaeraceae bacterium]
MISEAKLAANRRNSLKGGVKTREGKLKSRRNALKHGYRAEEVLPDDLQQEADAKFAQLVDEIRPEGTIETGLARRMALELTKLERLETEEHAALAARIREAGKAFDDLQRRRVEACVKLLPQQPARAVRGLLGITAGCNWLLEEWAGLRNRQESGAWGEEDERRAWHLLGGREVVGPPSIAACIAEEVAAVEVERDAVWEELDGPLRQEAEDRALLDTSPEGQIRQRNEGQAVRQLHKAIDQYCKGRQGWFEPKRGGRRRPAPNEPTAETVREMVLTAVTGVDSSPLAADHSPTPTAAPAPNEPTAETLAETPVASVSLPTLPLGEGRGEGGQHLEQVTPPGEPASLASSATMPPVAPNEPTAEVVKEQAVPAPSPDAGSTIRREWFGEPARPSVPMSSDGIRVR